MKKVFIVGYVSGYTGDAEIAVFSNLFDAELAFRRLRGETFEEFISDFGLTMQDIHKMSEEELNDKGIHYDDSTDITWDGYEVYERIFIQEKEVLP